MQLYDSLVYPQLDYPVSTDMVHLSPPLPTMRHIRQQEKDNKDFYEDRYSFLQ